jgi:peptide/nickel transport system ATP-binding protein
MSLLEIQNLYVNLKTGGKVLPVLQDISFSIEKAQILSLVGESGSGKSLTCLAITKLLPQNIADYQSGEIRFNGQNLLNTTTENLRKIRGKEISYIFQDPFTSLNPIQKIKDQIIESYLIHISQNKKEALEKAEHLLHRVGITELKERMESYPGQMSGGMLQRISIAMSLMCDPQLLIADEPTSALDVTIQSQLVELLLDLKKEIGMSILFISHDLALVGTIAEKIAVMYAGQIVETGTTEDLIQNPKHPYTKALLKTIPSIHSRGQILETIPGIVPSPLDFPTGCHFSTRCKEVMEKCKTTKPKMYNTGHDFARCFLYEKESV